MEKEFDELTIADDYMFYRVMEDPEICKTLLNRVLQGKVETITEIELQKTIDDAGRAKGVRFDVWAKDCNGRIYDIEMSFSDRHPCLSENTSFAVWQNIATAWNHRHPWRYCDTFSVAVRIPRVLSRSDGDVSKVGYFFDIPASLKLSLYTVMT